MTRNKDFLDCLAMAISFCDEDDQLSIFWTLYNYYRDGRKPGENTIEYQVLEMVMPMIDEVKENER